MVNELFANINQNYFFSEQWGSAFFGFGFLFALLLIWSLFWKGWSLWKAARSSDKKWFIALLIINTAGILDILYIYIFSKKRK